MAVVKAGLAAAALLLIAAKPVPAPVPAAAPAVAPAAPSVRAGVEKWKAGDYPAAVAMWQGFAAAGDADALFNMGQAYKLGRGVAQDAATARDYYRKAAMKGHLPAQANLGIALFQVGEKPEAIKWLRTAADRGEARAQYVLGIAAYNGDGLPRSQAVGYGYLLRAQASGLPQATTALGSIAPALSPTDRTAGEAVAASIASGNGVPVALAAASAPKLITPVASAGNDVLKPLPGAAKPVATASIVPAKPTVVPVTSTAAPLPAAIAQTKPVTPPPAFASVTPAPKPAASTLVPPSAAGPTRAMPVSNPQAVAVASPPVKPADKPVQGPFLAGAPPANTPPVAVATTDIPASRPTPIPTPVTAKPTDAPVPAPAALASSNTPAPAPLAVAKADPPKPAPVTLAPKPVATVALKPFETIAPAKPTAKKPGWRVQLGAFSARKQADLAWAAVKADAGTSKPIFDADGPVVKLQIGPFTTRDAAKAACAKLSDAGRSCFVTEG